jgi:hypothetical protein
MTRACAGGLAAMVVLLICAVDAIWLFGYALPRNPAPAAITLPQPNATEKQLESYDRKVDRAQLETWMRQRIVDSAISVPVVAAVCMGMAVLLAGARSTE